ncbi:MAG: hypothetical protein R3230_01380 [Nitrosopumilaceae archaeon]|nr:hypothetical protein [Nitrosopumilaceae archaeon]
MVVVVQDPRSRGINQSISALGDALASIIGGREQRKAQKREQQEEGILQSVFSNLQQDSQPINIFEAVVEASKKGVPFKKAAEFGGTVSNLYKLQSMLPPSQQEILEARETFVKAGIPEDQADQYAQLWAQNTTGGRTEITKSLLDRLSRTPQQTQQQMPIGSSVQMQPPMMEEEITENVEEFRYPDVNIFEGFNPREKAKFKADLYKDNKKDYMETTSSIKSYDGMGLRLNQLDRLNNSGKLPKSFGRLNINAKTGDLVIPAAANEETQLFVKTINDFTTEAKDSYGSRITNFELNTFLKRLPTLANTEEGRRVILSQMQSLNDLNKLYENSLKTVYDQYGLQGIDRQNAEKIAEELRKDEEDKIKKRFEESIQAQERFEESKKVKQQQPKGYLSVQKPDGTKGYIPPEMKDKAIKEGWKIL